MDESRKAPSVEAKDIDHLGIVSGIIDEIGLVEEVDLKLGSHPQQCISPGEVLKAMILNGLGFVSAPLYLFEEFFIGKATYHLIGEGIEPSHLNDDRLGRVLDKLYEGDLTELFVSIAGKAADRYGVCTDSVALDATSFALHRQYEVSEDAEQPEAIRISRGYSRDHRPDLKQFVVDLMSTADGGVPVFMRVADGQRGLIRPSSPSCLGTFAASLTSMPCLSPMPPSTGLRTSPLWGAYDGCAGCRPLLPKLAEH